MLTGRNRALLVGCNYPNTQDELQGSYKNVQDMRETLMNIFLFKPGCIEVLTDKPGSAIMPTSAIIMAALNRMVDQAERGDVMFFYFSGHGMILEPPKVHRTVQAIVPCDHNIITSVDLRHLVDRVPSGATFTILADSSHSGGLIDKESVQNIGPNQASSYQTNAPVDRPKMISYESMLQKLSSVTGLSDPNIGVHLSQMFGSEASLMFRLTPDQYPMALKQDQGILLSGCQPNEQCHDGPETTGSAFSSAVQKIFKEKGRHLSNKEIVKLARQKLADMGCNNQHPCLYCSDEKATAIFLTAAGTHE